MSTNRQICFVIMPFSETTNEHTEDYWTGHFESFLKPLIEENSKLEARRSQPLRGDILRQIINDLVVSPVVVVDLTDNNPNVYWELGVRQSFKHGTVTIAEEGTRLPFDLGAKGTLFYSPKDHLKMESFRRLFRNALQDCSQHPDRPDSHVLETIFGRGTLFQIFRRDEAIRRLKAVLSEYTRNSIILGHVIKRILENRENPKNRKYITDRLGMSAVELLVTNRYVDEDEPFFGEAEKYLGGIVSINEALNRWKNSPNSTEKWLLQTNETMIDIMDRFRAKVEQSRGKLTRLV